MQGLTDLLHAIGFQEDSRYTLLRSRDSSVYLVEPQHVVVKLSNTPDAFRRASKEVAVARYLSDHAFPASRPVEWMGAWPIQIGAWTATIWQYTGAYGKPPSASEMGTLLRHFHLVMLGFGESSLSEFDPIAQSNSRLQLLLNQSRRDRGDLEWLVERANVLAERLKGFNSCLGQRRLHGDFYVGNVINTKKGPVLIDFEEVSLGAAEWDLVAPLVAIRRFGLATREATKLFAAYGADPRPYVNMALLSEIRELWMVVWLLERRFESVSISQEASRRMESLRAGDLSSRWNRM